MNVYNLYILLNALLSFIIEVSKNNFENINY